MNDLIKKLLHLHEEFPPAENLPMETRARIVLIEDLGEEPTKRQIEDLCFRAKQAARQEKLDHAFIELHEREQSTNLGKKEQTGGGHRVIRKPGLFGG